MSSSNEDEKINQIFSKHLNSNLVKREKVNFNTTEVKKNQNEIDNFLRHDIVKVQNHFCIDEKELNSDDENENEEKNEEFNYQNKDQNNNKKDIPNKGYFKSVLEETLNNEGLYCSYLDSFDKMWIHNKNIKNKNSLSCAGCFNQISYAGESVKFSQNLMTTKKMINTFLDYLVTYNGNELVNLINDSIKGDKIKEDIFIDIGVEIDSIHKNFVSVKCENCYIILGVYNSENKQYLIVNSI